MKNVLFYLVILTVFLSCDPKETDSCHRRINFRNNSNKDVYIKAQYYSDTLLSKYDQVVDKIKTGEYNETAMASRSCFEVIFDRGQTIPSGVIKFFIFDAHVLETTPWDTVVTNYMILKRYDLTLQDLQDLNWTINYP